MSYLFPIGSTTEPGVLEVGSNINVLDGIISIPQSIETTANVAFNNITANGSVSGGSLYDNSNRVITTVTPTSGPGISLTGITSTGPTASFVVNNTGVLSLIAGSGITLSGNTGNITVSAIGADIMNTIGVTTNYTATATDEYIGVDSTTLVTVTLPPGINGRQYIIKEEHGAGTGKVNVQGTALETIDGSPFKQLAALASLTVVFRAGAWRIV